MYVFLFILTFLFNDGGSITEINRKKSEAEASFKKGEYDKAITQYTALLGMGVNEPKVVINLAHAYFKQGDKENAAKYYEMVSGSSDKNIASVANQQLGVLQGDKPENIEKALEYFKKALLQNPQNEDARYNYELLKKKKQQQDKDKQDKKDQDKKNEDKKDDKKENQDKKDQDKKDNSKDKESKDNKDKDNKDSKDQQNKEQKQKEQEQKEKDQKENPNEQAKKDDKKHQKDKQQRLQEINMSDEKAKMILDALKNNEIQYYQQLQKKPSKKPDNSKPDW
jgi:tetratricopeptide (TPR) repeat protein